MWEDKKKWSHGDSGEGFNTSPPTEGATWWPSPPHTSNQTELTRLQRSRASQLDWQVKHCHSTTFDPRPPSWMWIAPSDHSRPIQTQVKLHFPVSTPSQLHSMRSNCEKSWWNVKNIHTEQRTVSAGTWMTCVQSHKWKRTGEHDRN